MTITDVRDEEHGATALSLKSCHVVEMKERRNFKVLVVFLATTFMVLAGAILRGAQYYQSVSNSLFEKRSLQGLRGLCARRNKDFEMIDFYAKMPLIFVGQGQTKQYTTIVPKSTEGGVSVYYTAGQLTLFASYDDVKPTSGDTPSAPSVSCVATGSNGGGNSLRCLLREETRAQTMYIWIEGFADTNFLLTVGDDSFIW